MNPFSRPFFLLVSRIAAVLIPFTALGQDDEFSEFSALGLVSVRHGEGIQLAFPEEGYLFALEGLAQPGIRLNSMELDTAASFGTFIRRAYMTFRAVDEARGLNAVVRSDFTQAQPLLDVYLDYAPTDRWWVRIGQFQQPANNREMLFYEGHLSMPERSLVSRLFSQTGREFGLAFGGNWGAEDAFVVRPTLAITSGDGLNSFGTLSNDADRGGLKYSGRIDVLPFGDFDTESAVDLEREEAFRLAVGLATSYNDGASGPVGESHGEWALYNAAGEQQLPGYLKNVVDVLAKYRGITLLGEYVNAAAYGLDGAYTNPALGTLLMPTEISTYLMLGNAYNVQLGVALENGWAVDARFGQTFPEFAAEQPASQLQVIDALGGCLTWHCNEQALKLQLAADFWNSPDLPMNTGWFWTFQTQVQF